MKTAACIPLGMLSELVRVTSGAGVLTGAKRPLTIACFKQNLPTKKICSEYLRSLLRIFRDECHILWDEHCTTDTLRRCGFLKHWTVQFFRTCEPNDIWYKAISGQLLNCFCVCTKILKCSRSKFVLLFFYCLFLFKIRMVIPIWRDSKRFVSKILISMLTSNLCRVFFYFCGRVFMSFILCRVRCVA